jgi:glycine betaine/proline transport system substrate-binding protein
MKYFCALFFILFSSVAHSNPSTPAANRNPAHTVHIALNDWASQRINSYIIGNLFEQLGLKVKYIELTVDQQWAALSENRIQVQMEIWEGTMIGSYQELMAKKQIADAGSYTATSREEWWYPSYVEALCPGLPDWKALKNCAEVFESSTSSPKGLYLTGPWDNTDPLRIAALDLPFEILKLKNDKQLWQALKKAHDAKKPILMLNWTPNFIDEVHPGRFVEFPDFSPECETNAAWGINPKATHDCGNPKGGWIKKIASTEFKKKHPKAFKVLKNYDLTGKQFSQLIYVKEVLKISDKKAAKFWLNKNKTTWQSWIK